MAVTTLNDNTTELQQEVTEILLPQNALTTTAALRQSYAESMNKAPFNDETRMNAILETPEDQPIYEDEEFGGDDLPDRRKLLSKAMDVSMDIATLDSKIINTTNEYAKLIVNTVGRLNEVKRRLKQDEQREQDIQFVSQAYKGLSNVVHLNDQNMTGAFCYKNNTFMAAQTSIRQVHFDVTEVVGNGYSGNDYVLADNSFLKDSDDRSKLEYISDDSLLTVYEYSRLCSRDETYYYKASASPSDTSMGLDAVNYDDKDATCTFTFHTKGNTAVNMLCIDTDNQDIRILDVQTSNDGMLYTSALTNEIDLAADMYHAANYVPGSNIVCFPPTSHLKLVVSSGHVNAGEELGVSKTEIIGVLPRLTIQPLKDVVRKVISISGIRLYSCSYTTSSMHSIDICPSDGCKRVALFCNQYLPAIKKHSAQKEEKRITYTFYINGAPYEVKPINSSEEGIKMISCMENSYTESGVKFISEPIKTVQLKINIPVGDSSETAFVGNLMVCIG